ncbi:MAG: hypothetical protein AMXMBFR84_34240 [Candidatus Hydrogenedentota bacterium]
MNPNQLNDHDLDAFIEEALKAEPMRAVPTGFHKRVDARLKVAVLVQGERHKLRVRLLATTMIIATAAMVIVGLPVYAFSQGWLSQQMPGSRGYWDYMLVSVTPLVEALGMKGLVLCAAGLVALAAAAVIPAVGVTMARNR